VSIVRRVREAWKAIIGFTGGFLGPVVSAATENLQALDWANVTPETLRTALVTGTVTGLGVWAKANLPAQQRGRHAAESA
jgi:hypothetical protein